MSPGGQKRPHTSEKVIDNRHPPKQIPIPIPTPKPSIPTTLPHLNARCPESWIPANFRVRVRVRVPSSCALCVEALDKYLLRVAIDVELKIEIYANFYFAISLFYAPCPAAGAAASETWLMHHWRPTMMMTTTTTTTSSTRTTPHCLPSNRATGYSLLHSAAGQILVVTTLAS